MNTKTTKQKFVNLRVAGVTLTSAADTLDISLSTAQRWNKSLSSEITRIKNSKLVSLSDVLNPKIDSYLEFFEKNFEILKKELSKHNEFVMPYDKIVRNSARVMSEIRKLFVLKRTLSVFPDISGDFSDSLDNDSLDEFASDEKSEYVFENNREFKTQDNAETKPLFVSEENVSAKDKTTQNVSFVPNIDSKNETLDNNSSP